MTKSFFHLSFLSSAIMAVGVFPFFFDSSSDRPLDFLDVFGSGLAISIRLPTVQVQGRLRS